MTRAPRVRVADLRAEVEELHEAVTSWKEWHAELVSTVNGEFYERWATLDRVKAMTVELEWLREVRHAALRLRDALPDMRRGRAGGSGMVEYVAARDAFDAAVRDEKRR